MDVLLERKVGGIADDDRRHVQGHQAVAADQGGQAVGEQCERQDQDRIERSALEVDAAHQPARGVADAHADGKAGSDLPDQHQQHIADAEQPGAVLEGEAVGGRDDRDQQQRQGERRRVVAAGLQLEERVEVFAQVHPLAAQHGKHGRRIGRGQDTGQQDAAQQGLAGRADAVPEHEEEEKARREDGQQQAQRGKRQALLHHGFRMRERGLQAAGQQDDRDAQVAQEFGQLVVVDLDADAVRTGHHADDQEEEHARHAVFRAQPRNEDGGEHEHGQEQQDVPGVQFDGDGRKDGKHLTQDRD